MKRVVVVRNAVARRWRRRGAAGSRQADPGHMKANGKNLGGVLAPMFKGEKPYDQAAVDAALTSSTTPPRSCRPCSRQHQGRQVGGRLQPLAEDLGRQGRLRRQDRSFAKAVTEAKAKIKDLDSLKANFPHRQGMRRLPRDLPRQEGLTFGRDGIRGGRVKRPPFFFRPAELTSSPGRGFRRPDWLRCGC